MPDFDGTTYLLIALGFFLGGATKGMTGIGQPVLILATLANVMPTHLVLGLMTAPGVVTNVWQALHAGDLRSMLRRFWPMILVLMASMWIGTLVVVRMPPRLLDGVVGGIVVLFSLSTFVRPGAGIARHVERWAGPLVGALAGFMGGVAALMGPPLAMYLVALRLPKDDLIRAAALMQLCGVVPWAIGYIHNGLVTFGIGMVSLMACAPVMAGLWAGTMVRNRIDQATFRNVLLVVLSLIGLNLIRKAVFA